MNILSESLKLKIQALENWFTGKEGSIVAFSGGVDSALVLYLARLYQGKERAIGVISNSESLKQKDLNDALEFCKQFDIKIEIIKTRELEDVRYAANPANRCFYCKEHLFLELNDIAAKYKGFNVLSGTNYDDLGDFRPGIDAAKKLEVLSPLVDCKVTKEELREIARHFKLPVWNKPASPCLSSRLPYGHKVTAKKLHQIEQAENLLNTFGFENVRVRHYETYGKIEVPDNELPKLIENQTEILEKIKAFGFEDVLIDDEGLVSGKMNRAINNDKNE